MCRACNKPVHLFSIIHFPIFPFCWLCLHTRSRESMSEQLLLTVWAFMPRRLSIKPVNNTTNFSAREILHEDVIRPRIDDIGGWSRRNAQLLQKRRIEKTTALQYSNSLSHTLTWSMREGERIRDDRIDEAKKNYVNKLYMKRMWTHQSPAVRICVQCTCIVRCIINMCEREQWPVHLRVGPRQWILTRQFPNQEILLLKRKQSIFWMWIWSNKLIWSIYFQHFIPIS